MTNYQNNSTINHNTTRKELYQEQDNSTAGITRKAREDARLLINAYDSEISNATSPYQQKVFEKAEEIYNKIKNTAESSKKTEIAATFGIHSEKIISFLDKASPEKAQLILVKMIDPQRLVL